MRKPGDSYTPKDGDELVAFMKALCSKCDKDDVEGCWIIEDFREPVCEGDEQPEEWHINKFGNATCSAYVSSAGEAGYLEQDERCPNTADMFKSKEGS